MSAESRARVEPPFASDERTMLTAFLDYQRTTAVNKVLGLSESAARRGLVATTPVMTPIGVLRHLANVERVWFQLRLAGRDVPVGWTDDDPDADWKPMPGETLADVVAAYDAACAESRVIADAHGLDDVIVTGPDPITLRWILVHLVEETSRHNGHLDLLRESIDGATGE